AHELSGQEPPRREGVVCGGAVGAGDRTRLQCPVIVDGFGGEAHSIRDPRGQEIKAVVLDRYICPKRIAYDNRQASCALCGIVEVATQPVGLHVVSIASVMCVSSEI